jgi:uncharacterized protein (TIGR00251 family)
VIEAASGGVVLNVRVIPRSPTSRIAGARGDALLVRLVAAPVDGAANAALIDLLSSALQIPKSAISITAGKISRNKRVKIIGLDQAQIEARLRQATL